MPVTRIDVPALEAPPFARPAWRALAALASGIVFGVGLAVAQMIDPRKVLGFLDVAGAWDASLLFVLGAAVVLAALAFRVVLRRPGPLFDSRFHLSSTIAVDWRLLAGSAIFGVGWGLGGYCPGPAIASLGFANTEAFLFVPAMVAGMGLHRWQARHSAR